MLRTAQGVWSCLNFSSNQIIKLKGGCSWKTTTHEEVLEWDVVWLCGSVCCAVLITSDLDFFSAAMSWTLSLCSFGAERYMSSSSFISLWDSWAFLHSQHHKNSSEQAKQTPKGLTWNHAADNQDHQLFCESVFCLHTTDFDRKPAILYELLGIQSSVRVCVLWVSAHFRGHYSLKQRHAMSRNWCKAWQIFYTALIKGR